MSTLYTLEEAEIYTNLICAIAKDVCELEDVPARAGAVVWTSGYVGTTELMSKQELEEGETHTIRINLNALIKDSELIDKVIKQYNTLNVVHLFSRKVLTIILHEIGHVVHYEKALQNGIIDNPDDYLEKTIIGLISSEPELFAEYIVFKYYNIILAKYNLYLPDCNMQRDLIPLHKFVEFNTVEDIDGFISELSLICKGETNQRMRMLSLVLNDFGLIVMTILKDITDENIKSNLKKFILENYDKFSDKYHASLAHAVNIISSIENSK